jgi:two-component system cell cycle response regulator
MTAKILIVDDINFNVELLEEKMRKEHYDVYKAFDGQQALEVAKDIKPDIILMDVMMPVMNGLTAIKAMRSTPDISLIPIIIITALHSQEDKVRGLLHGADEYITKPINYLILNARIKSLLRLKFTTDEFMLRIKVNKELAVLSDDCGLMLESELKNEKILLIDDDVEQKNIIFNGLKDKGFIVDNCSNPKNIAFKTLEKKYSLIIVNMELRDVNAMELCMKIQNNTETKHVPLLILIDKYDEKGLINSLEAGVNDYVCTPLDFNELYAKASLQIKKFKYQENIKFLYIKGVVKDGLTGLYNRKYLEFYCNRILKQQDQLKQYILCMLDVDNFKKVNDTYGHTTGDNVLKHIAQVILDVVREVDLVARFGGDEFVIILHKVTKEKAVLISERIQNRIMKSELLDFSGKNKVTYTVSVGVYEIKKGDNTQNAIDRADKNLYVAKKAGKNLVVA